jgi:adenylate cyclase
MSPGSSASFITRLRNGGIRADDTPEERLNKSLLLLATGLVCVASILWLAVYWTLGPKLSATLPFVYQLLLAGNLLLYIRSGNFSLFRNTQLGLFLFMPFVAQWAIGNFITASGILLWGLLAPIGAILCIGSREALAWFFAYAFLIVLTSSSPSISLAVSTIIYMLLRFVDRGEASSQPNAWKKRTSCCRSNRSARKSCCSTSCPARRRAAEELEQDHCRRLCRRHRDVRRHRELHPGGRQHVAVAGIRHAEPDLLRRSTNWPSNTAGKDQDHRRCLHGGRRPERELPDYAAAIADMAYRHARPAAQRDFVGQRCTWKCASASAPAPSSPACVGKKKFIYDLWGDTVNIASRITSEGVPGMIQVDTTTYHRLRTASTSTSRRRSTSRARAT